VAEVRLPLTDEELAMLELPELLKGQEPLVRFAVELPVPETLAKGQWQGVARRVEAQREATTLLNYLDVEIHDPFSLLEKNPAEPLKLNTFLQARIPGKTLHRVFRIDRALLLRGDELNIYKPDNTLEIRPVHVLYRDKQYAYVDRGLKPGERIIITPIVSPYNGMKLRLAEETAPRPARRHYLLVCQQPGGGQFADGGDYRAGPVFGADDPQGNVSFHRSECCDGHGGLSRGGSTGSGKRRLPENGRSRHWHRRGGQDHVTWTKSRTKSRTA